MMANWYQLRERFAHLSLAQGFDELLCLPHLRGIETFWYQVETVRKVLKQFRGRVLLADEVGLGKTIEAGMVLKEYLLRGMVESVLVLVPASLVGQWREELDTKFDIACATTHDALLRADPGAFWSQKRMIASLALARRSEHAGRLLERTFDLVIVDEAHHLRDRASQSYKLVDGLNKRFLLLLSATPVQNDLTELYNLLTLLKPGIFKTLKEFRAAYVTAGKPRQPANPERLRELMRDAMIRNTRAVVALEAAAPACRHRSGGRGAGRTPGLPGARRCGAPSRGRWRSGPASARVASPARSRRIVAGRGERRIDAFCCAPSARAGLARAGGPMGRIGHGRQGGRTPRPAAAQSGRKEAGVRALPRDARSHRRSPGSAKAWRSPVSRAVSAAPTRTPPLPASATRCRCCCARSRAARAATFSSAIR